MPLRQSFTSFARYYQRVLRQMRKDLGPFAVQQIIIAVPLALSILLLQIRWGITPPDLTFYNVLAIALPYFVILILAVVIYGLRAPWQLDTALQSEIEQLKRAGEIPVEEKIEKLTALVTRGYELQAQYQDESSNPSTRELAEWMGQGVGSILAYVGQPEAYAFAQCLKQIPPSCPVKSEEHRNALSVIYPRIRRLEKHVEKLRAQQKS